MDIRQLQTLYNASDSNIKCRLSENSGKIWRKGSGYGIIKPSKPQWRAQTWGTFKERIATK